jgi:hypothetical protein
MAAHRLAHSFELTQEILPPQPAERLTALTGRLLDHGRALQNIRTELRIHALDDVVIDLMLAVELLLIAERVLHGDGGVARDIRRALAEVA